MKLKSHLWHKTAIAAAATGLIGLWAPSASALSLGSITVQSALGEPLRAEIDVPDINAEESSTLKAAVASPEAFRSAGLDYNAAMAGLRVSLQRRPDGRAYIRLTSERPVNEPFVDMILEATWSTGRIVRDFTMLFDPPNLRGGVAPTATLPQVVATPSATPPAAPRADNPVGTSPPRPVAAAPRKPVPAPAGSASPKAAAASSVARPAAEPATAGERQIRVKSGDTASKIAATVKPASISLDQMLVALLRANPNAFIEGNINRIKSGALVTVPTAEQAQAISASEATQTVIAQSKDFNDFRKKLAGYAPTTRVAVADRQSSGSVQAKVDDKKASTNAPDKLTLSKGAVQAQANTDKIARERAAKDASSKQAELSKNISELGKIGAASSPALPIPAAPMSPIAPVSPATPAVAPPSTVGAGALPGVPVASTAGAPAALASSPAVPVVPQAAISSAAPAPAKRPAPIAPMPAAEPGFIDQLLENPLVPAGAAGLVALLAGFGIYRSRQKKKASEADSAFLESRLQPDSFFGASGGQRVDTNDAAQTGSSMVYSPSQLDAADDVDPVAEADVYLAYGRDMQAEEILKEASKANPGRVAIQQKLLEIYAKRRDANNFERVANQAYKITSGEGPDWQRVCELGLGIDPSNALYQPGGEPSRAGALSQPAPLAAAGGVIASTIPMSLPLQPASSAPSDLDLDLDFSLDDENASVMSELRSTERTASMDRVETGPGALDFDLAPSTHGFVATDFSGTAQQSTVKFALPELDQTLPILPAAPGDSEDFRHQAAVSFGSTAPIPLLSETSGAAAHKAPESGMLEFDLGSLSLDLGDSTEGTSASTAAASAQEDPLATKLSLAEEFSAIGDDDGARALIEEVISEASGDMKLRAQHALSSLS